MAIKNPAKAHAARRAMLTRHENEANKSIANVSSETSGGLPTKYASTPIKSVGTFALPEVNGVDLEQKARDSYLKKYDILILNDNFAKKGFYHKSDFTNLTKAELDQAYKKLSDEVDEIYRKYKEMREISPAQMISLRHLVWLRSLKSNYESQSKIYREQVKVENRLKSQSASEDDVLHSKIQVNTPGFSDKGREHNVMAAAYKNANSQVYDAMDHSNPWRTSTDLSNRKASAFSKITKYFGGKTATTKEESNAKKHLKDARKILVTSNAVNDDKKFKSTGAFDKYTTDAIVKIAEGKDVFGIKDVFGDKELDYIKDVISKMPNNYTWEFTIEDTYMNGEVFSECESSLVNVESDELVEESAIEELQQLADLL